MFNFEELKPYLYKWAIHFFKFYKDRFEINELINEVWVKGNAQKMSTLQLAGNRIKYDMLDYIRRENGRKRIVKGEFKKRPIFLTNIRSYLDTDKETSFFDKQNIYFKGFVELENKEEIDHLLNFLSIYEQQFIYYYYYKNMTIAEIGKKINLSSGHVCQIISKIKTILKQCSIDGFRSSEFLKSDKLKNILPEYVDDYLKEIKEIRSELDICV